MSAYKSVDILVTLCYYDDIEFEGTTASQILKQQLQSI